MNKIKDSELILIADIGSTTTKGLLLEKKDGKYYFKAISNEPTTVEQPHEDVNIGLNNAVKILEEKSGMTLTAPDGKLAVPFLATSSAGGGLQVIVFGLTKSETGKAVEATAYGAGAVISGSFTVDDGIREMDKMRMIRELHPDMILMAGGIDGGGIWGILRQAEILTLAQPRSKFMPEDQIPLVFCGNIEAREFVKDILGEHFHVHITDNIRPTLESFNFEPVRNKVHQLFMENVMENAPGYKEVKKIVSKNILPTPTGVELILKNYYEKHKENTLLVDIGGATTDIFSCIENNINRTVSANIGMSYSISNILKESGAGAIMDSLCGKISENEIRDYISNKMLNPEYIPQTKGERFIELSCAAEGIRLAWEQHLSMNMEVNKMGFLDRRRKGIFEHSQSPFEEVFNLTAKNDVVFQLSDINKIIGAGGVISSSDNTEDVIFMLSEGFSPYGITELYVDRHFKSPHLGMFSLVDPEQAVEVYERETLSKVCTVVALTGAEKVKTTENGFVLTVTDLSDKTSAGMKPGEVFYMKKGGHFRFEAGKDCSFGNNGTVFEIDTDKGILLDCRLNHFKKDSSILFRALYGEPKEMELSYKFLKGRNEIFKGEFEITRSLPYKGEILVQEGMNVNIDTVIAQNLFNPPKIYMINVRKLVGIEEKLTKEEIAKGMQVKKGDIIEYGQPVFSYAKKGDPVPVNYNSNVSGEIVKIDDYGMIIVKEIQDYGDEPVVMDIAKHLEIKPKELRRYFNMEVGDFVQKGQTIASKTTGNSVMDMFNTIFESKQEKHDTMIKVSGHHFIFKSTSTGYITAINTEKGTVTVQYKSKPEVLKSFVNGRVVKVHKDISADLKVTGSYAYCIIGFGGENYGQLSFSYDNKNISEKHEGKIAVFTQPITKSTLDSARQFKVKGIIAPSISNKDWVDFCGKEIRVAVTGKENIGFTLMLTEGFGYKEMNADYKEFFVQNEGAVASLNGRTQIRAGVIRPRIIIS
jgi:uncharacterized protein (TIGR01319 family)